MDGWVERKGEIEKSLCGAKSGQTLCFTSAWFRLHTKSHGAHDHALCYSSTEAIDYTDYTD